MTAHRRVLVALFVTVGCVACYYLIAEETARPRPVLDGDGAMHDVTSVGVDAASSHRVAVPLQDPQQRPSAEPEQQLGFWPLDGARRDEYGILLDLKPYLHRSINNYAADLDGSAKALRTDLMLRETAVNPQRLELTAEDHQRLKPLLESPRQAMAELGPVSVKALAEAYHQLIERGDMQHLARSGPDPQAAQRRFLEDFKRRFGPQHREFEWVLAGGLYDRDPATGRMQPGGGVDQYVLALHRGIAPDAFEILDEVNGIKDAARQILRQYLASRR